jgi:AraC-like DNA-binding protein
MALRAETMDTDALPPAERIGFWRDRMARLFQGLASHEYGDTEFHGRTHTVQLGGVVMTRLEATRHHVERSARSARAAEVPYLKIVAPFSGCAGIEQRGRETWVTPGQWCVYDTTQTYAVANPERVEHLIVMIPKVAFAGQAESLQPLMARRLGGSGGIARVALETMRQAFREAPNVEGPAAEALAGAIAQLVQHSLLDLAGQETALGQRAALRERIKRHVALHLAEPRLSVDAIAGALGVSRRQLYVAFADEPDGVAGYVLAERIAACRRAFDDRALAHRSITTIALDHGFQSLAHFSRVFRARFGVAPSDYRRAAAG